MADYLDKNPSQNLSEPANFIPALPVIEASCTGIISDNSDYFSYYAMLNHEKRHGSPRPIYTESSRIKRNFWTSVFGRVFKKAATVTYNQFMSRVIKWYAAIVHHPKRLIPLLGV
ncbi:unnamed protein product [Macrosiphum euphorbiae]|uniref:Uncharacterized protein n=1 Tax=Macrosiphum euphorbiae TaxID=13131 RepID=A0AAV0VW77_9HEMI|nr:unnamed protein product [Macrosiphum euphorbiae]